MDVKQRLRKDFVPKTFFLLYGGKRADESLDGKRSAPPTDTRNTRGVTGLFFRLVSVSTSQELDFVNVATSSN
uniref:SFRICE_007412 n=1 Tax=Spodoptera frugiperda TaxID=7108 RepID=A0A2H1WCR2_SPOFR